jgi:membrane-associated protease RseP (regulator of RpoE activity)
METMISPLNLGDQQEVFSRAVRQVFQIEAVTTGNNVPRKRIALAYNPANGAPIEYLARYSGRLVGESEAAFERLTALLANTQAIPIFRLENDQQVIYLISSQAIPQHGRSNPLINLVLFILTLISVIFTGGMYNSQALPSDPLHYTLGILAAGWPFALSMLGILAVHEFGHYIAGRLHKLDVSLPYFIPFPLSIMGTMGAFINMRSVPKNRNHLLDVGISGPLAGLVVTIVVLWLGLKTSVLDTLPIITTGGIPSIQIEGNSLLYLLMKFLAFGQLLPQPTTYAGMPALLYWLRYFFTSLPPPSGGTDVMLNSVAWAGWCGLLVTALNLMPAGQLDGGHISYVLFGRKWMRRFFPVVLGVTVLLGFIWSGWWLWTLLLYFFGRFYAEPLDQITPLSPMRKVLAIVAIGVFILTFIPVPLNLF